MEIRSMGAGAKHLRAVMVLLLLAAPAFAGEDGPTLEPDNLALLPLNDLERKELARDHPDVAARVHYLGNRLKKIRAQLAERPDPGESGARRLRELLRQTEQDLAPSMARIREACREHELTDALLAHMKTAPAGPQRTTRYAHGLVLFVLDADAPARPMFEAVVPTVEGAILALEAQKEPLRRTLKQGGMADEEIAPVIEALERRIRGIDKRFWRLVDYVVPEADKAALHRVLPTAYQKQDDILAHLFALPGLTASQAVRLRGVLVAFEAETAPDTALTRRLQAQLRAKDLDASERMRIQEEMQSAGNRVTERHRAATTAAQEILTEAQWTMLEAIPPRVSLGDRRQTSPQVLEGLAGVDPTKLAAMRKELAGARREIQEKKIAAAAKGKDYGPDSPQMTSMQMAMANVEAEANVLQRRFNGRLFTELLTRDQVVVWVINPP